MNTQHTHTRSQSFRTRPFHALSPVAALLLGSAAFAQPVNSTFTYQGEITNAGTPVTATYDMQFRLYDAASGGSQVGGTLCADNVSIVNGKFTTQLDFGAQFAGAQRFLGIEVRTNSAPTCATISGFVAMAGRQALTATPNASYALTASSAATANFAANAGNANTANLAGDSNNLGGQGPIFYRNAGNLALGTLNDLLLSPNVPLLSTTNTFTANNSFSANTYMNGFVGIGTGTPVGAGSLVVRGNVGGTFYSGMYIDSIDAVGTPFYGFATGGAFRAWTQFFGGTNEWSLINTTVTGNQELMKSNASGDMIFNNNVGIGPDGATGHKLTVSMTPDVTSDISAFRLIGPGNAAGTNYGELARFNFGDSNFAYLDEWRDDSLRLHSSTFWIDSTSIGINTDAPTQTLQVNGGFTAVAKFFTIDDPADPANKMMVHATIESDQYVNLYRGTANLDATGNAVIDMPRWFDDLNEDASYQLTAVGAPMPGLYVSQEMQGDTFAVAGGAAHGKVSWTVTAVRKDAYAKAHPFAVEQDKPVGVRGKYFSPKEHGVAETLGVGYNPESAKSVKTPVPTQDLRASEAKQREMIAKMQGVGSK